jgi:hypothetical protein
VKGPRPYLCSSVIAFRKSPPAFTAHASTHPSSNVMPSFPAMKLNRSCITSPPSGLNRNFAHRLAMGSEMNKRKGQS